MRTYFAAFIAITVVGCTDDPLYETLGPQIRNASVGIDVIGDKSTAPSSLTLNVDGKPSAQVVPGEETLLTVEPGTHSFELAPPTALNEQWCSVIGERSFQAIAPARGLVRVTFTLDCPPIQGTGVLQFTLTGNYYCCDILLTRLNGVSSIVRMRINPNRPIPIILASGLWQLSMSDNLFCTAPKTTLVLAVRSDNTSEHSTITGEYHCLNIP